MTIREATIAKLQQLPESLLQQVSDFIDRLTDKKQHSPAIDTSKDELAEAWIQWFKSVGYLEATPIEPTSGYQQLLLAKYRQQDLEL